MFNTSYKNLEKELSSENFRKISTLDNPALFDLIDRFIKLCEPKSVFVCDNSEKDREYIRKRALELNEEIPLNLSGHTAHFDGYFDQARDKQATKYLVPKDEDLGKYLNSIDKDEGLKEIEEFFKGSMKNKEMIIAFSCLGPLNSDFSILAVQITDSFYIAHSEDILYRPGYEEFKEKKPSDFFKFIHTAGKLKNYTSEEIDKRRIYIDLKENTVYSTNTQYAGNTLGMKKPALRLAIRKAANQGWLAEHMFVMGVKGEDAKKNYFCGAFPSMCGKTSTAMIEGESIVGDDIAYLRIHKNKVFAANVERGIFGIIKGVNPKDDSLLFKSLSNPGEIIFSNILITEDNSPFWIGKQLEIPHKGKNFFGEWYPGKTDDAGKEIPPSHKNARYTIRIKALDNADENIEPPQGVEIKGIIYGGRDSDTWVPVEQAFSWQQGIMTKAAGLESETTAAALEEEGIRLFNPMSNMDFLSIPLGEYLKSNLSFGKKITNPPLIFSVNYFLKGKHGNFLNDIEDKRIWLKWINLRTENKAKALMTPTGLIPEYNDLKILFKTTLNKEYSKDDYLEQFTLRIPENLNKIERIRNIYLKLDFIPEALFEEFKAQEKRLKSLQSKSGDYVSPDKFSKE